MIEGRRIDSVWELITLLGEASTTAYGMLFFSRYESKLKALQFIRDFASRDFPVDRVRQDHTLRIGKSYLRIRHIDEAAPDKNLDYYAFDPSCRLIPAKVYRQNGK